MVRLTRRSKATRREQRSPVFRWSWIRFLDLGNALDDGAVEVSIFSMAFSYAERDSPLLIAPVIQFKPELLHQSHRLRIVVEGVVWALGVWSKWKVVNGFITPVPAPAIGAFLRKQSAPTESRTKIDES